MQTTQANKRAKKLFITLQLHCNAEGKLLQLPLHRPKYPMKQAWMWMFVCHLTPVQDACISTVRLTGKAAGLKLQNPCECKHIVEGVVARGWTVAEHRWDHDGCEGTQLDLSYEQSAQNKSFDADTLPPFLFLLERRLYFKANNDFSCNCPTCVI